MIDMAGSVDFALGERRAVDGRDVVEFVGDRDGRVLHFWITKEALEYLAGAKSHSLTLLGMFDAWKEKVWRVAEAKCAKIADDHQAEIIIDERDAKLFWKAVNG